MERVSSACAQRTTGVTMSESEREMNRVIRMAAGREVEDEQEAVDEGPLSEEQLFSWEDGSTLMNALIRRAARDA